MIRPGLVYAGTPDVTVPRTFRMTFSDGSSGYPSVNDSGALPWPKAEEMRALLAVGEVR
jgi:hypothetical protein